LLIALGGAFGRATLYGAVFFAAAMNLVAYFFSDRLVLAMQRAQPVDEAAAPRLHAIVAELAQRAGIPKPRVYLIPTYQPNAFATGRNPERAVVAVTEGILELLSERELRAVLAHEIGHVKNRDILIASVAATIAAAISYLAQVLQFSLLFGGGRDREEGGSAFGGLFALIVAPIAATLVQLGISRSREFLADERGAQLSGDPEALASALRKLEHGVEQVPAAVEPATASLFIVNPLAASGRSLLRLFSTHPPTDERVARLLEMAGKPEFGRRVMPGRPVFGAR
jgi:heat shock protein HtpX